MTALVNSISHRQPTGRQFQPQENRPEPPHDGLPASLLQLDAKLEKSRSVFSEPHLAQITAVSLCESTKSSNFSPQFLHLYSNIGNSLPPGD
jgi:hypothetical protein